MYSSSTSGTQGKRCRARTVVGRVGITNDGVYVHDRRDPHAKIIRDEVGVGGGITNSFDHFHFDGEH